MYGGKGWGGATPELAQKPLDNLEAAVLSFIKEAILAHRLLFTGATVMVATLKLCALAPAFFLGRIIDSLSAHQALNAYTIGLLLAAFCAVTILQSVINPLQTYQLTKLVQLTLKDKSIEWTTAIMNKEFEQFSSLRLGALIKGVERGITAHEKLLSFFILNALPLTIELLLVAAAFIYVGGNLLFVMLLATSIAYLTACHRLIIWRRPHLEAVNDQEDLVSTQLFDGLSAGKAIKLEHATLHALQPLFNSYGSYAQAATQVASSAAVLGSARILFVGLSTAALLAWGIHDRFQPVPTLSVGELVAIFSIAGGLLVNISGLADAYRTLDQYIADKRRLVELLDLDGLPLDHPMPDDLQAEQIGLLPQPGEALVPLRFNTSQSVAIVGASGAGKTTLLETLAGLVATARHRLIINDSPMEHLTCYLKMVRYCPQHPGFVEGEFRQAVLFGQPPAPVMEPYVDALGLRTLVDNRTISEGGKNISGGEAKRLTLLRLINRPGRFNLFDEPTASLDAETTTRVWNVLFAVFQGKGLVCITHDVDALHRFDRVLVMRAGRVVADGPWQELKGRRDVGTMIEEIGG